MDRHLIEILACPTCKMELSLSEQQADGEKIISGILTCTKCGADYPIRDGIPNLLPHGFDA